MDGFTKQKLTSDDQSGLLGLIGLILAVICFVAPFRPFKAMFHSCGYDEPEFAEEDYDKVCLTFSTDYDKENPLTIKSGQLRLLN